MKAYIVRLDCLTNMHVGNGDVNYNVIDNEVERDPVTKYPTINASGVKGALREFFRMQESPRINEIFGADTGGKNEQGKVKILGADMIAIPGRASGGEKPFYLITTQEAVKRVNELAKTFINKEIISRAEPSKEVEVEGYKLNKKSKIGDKEIYIMDHEDFDTISLPVLARNKLDNGESKNLWYEEIVPHDSIFAFPVVSEDGDLVDEFIKTIKDKVVQFGGNASIGYGLCKVTFYGKEDGNE
jgi:CRISPR-associated protein Cmr4